MSRTRSMPQRRVLATLVVTLVVAALLPQRAEALVGDFDYTEDSSHLLGAFDMAVSADGTLWFTNLEPGCGPCTGDHSIGRMAPDGTFTYFSDAHAVVAQHITAGPDGNMWFTEGNTNDDAIIGRVTPDGTITMFPDTTGLADEPFAIAPGPDGQLWFSAREHNRIARISTAGVVSVFPGQAQVSNPNSLTAGPDGNMWFTSGANDRIGRITPGGAITTFRDPAGHVDGPAYITAGPDGNLWFINTFNGRLGRITPTGVITTFLLVDSGALTGLTPGPGNTLWAGYASVSGSGSSGRILRIRSDGTVTEFADAGPGARLGAPWLLTSSSDGTLLFDNRGLGATPDDIGRFHPPGICNGEDVTVRLADGDQPTNGDDVIAGTDASERIDGLAGDDTICAAGGGDTVNGGKGHDLVLGGRGADSVNGNGGNDDLRGQDGRDTINGAAGNDRMNGGAGSDTCNGSMGTDTAVNCEARTGVP